MDEEEKTEQFWNIGVELIYFRSTYYYFPFDLVSQDKKAEFNLFLQISMN